nr:uncharacterized mitochondrial protein AtMg00810-like [Tanacetum cinerariifolium]
MKVEESLNVTFDESPPPTKLSPLVDDDVGEEDAIRKNTKIELVPLALSQSVIGTKGFFRNKLDENGIVFRNKDRLVAQGYNQQEGLQIKQIEDEIFFNQSKYIKEMLKKFGLEDSKPAKTPMSTEIKLTKEDESDSVDSSKYRENPKNTHLEAVKRIFRYIIENSHLRLSYPKVAGIDTVVYAGSDQAGDHVDRKITSGVCTFMGCCLTSWFAKKQTDLAIFMTEAEYVSAEKACQQALWVKQALIDYGIRLENVPIMCDNKGATDLSKNPV